MAKLLFSAGGGFDYGAWYVEPVNLKALFRHFLSG